MKRIHKVAILGAGTMGARIAAHFANAGVPSLLLDIVPPDADGPARNKIAVAGLDGAKKSKPAAFFEASLARLVTVGNFDDDLKGLAEVDWIIEAIVENLEIKRALLKRVEAIRKPGTIVTTNTSGLPVSKIAEGFSDDFRRSWFGTHFFNPPRYMRLLELIPTPEADRALIEAVTRFCDLQLGKGVVLAKDTPNFIGNRIGDAAYAGNGSERRRHRRAHRPSRGLAALGYVPHDRSGGARHPRARGLEYDRERARRAQRITDSRFLPPDAGTQMARRQDPGRLLQEECGAVALARRTWQRRRAPGA
jgi:hypothetical protein